MSMVRYEYRQFVNLRLSACSLPKSSNGLGD